MSPKQDIPAIAPIDASASTPARHVAAVDGRDVVLLALDLPARLRGPAREDVARRQVRDQLGPAADHTEMRPFSISGAGDQWHQVLVADRATLADWRARTGSGCCAVLPDYLCLAAAPDLWVVSGQGGVVSARLGLSDGFSAEPDLALALIGAALAAAGETPPQAAWVSGPDTAPIVDALQAHGIATIPDAGAAAKLGSTPPAAFANGELALDLRADPMAARARVRARVLPWRWPVLAGLVAAAIWAAALLVELRALDQAIATQRRETMAMVRTTFVPSGPVLDIRTQVARALAARQDAARDWQGRVSALTLLGQGARVLAGADAEVLEISMDETSVDLVLRVADFAAADRLVNALGAANLAVSVSDLRVSDGDSGARAQLRLTAPPEETP